MGVMNLVLKEELCNGSFREYKINNGDYQPQQYYWASNESIDEILKGNCRPSKAFSNKPAGIWISGSEGWVGFCELRDSKYLVNCTPLKAYVSPEIEVCEISSMEDFRSICEEVGVELSNIPLYANYEASKEGFSRVFNFIKKGYGGIHLSHRGRRKLNDILYGWDTDSTVIFESQNLRFEQLTAAELRLLGWDKYEWISTSK